MRVRICVIVVFWYKFSNFFKVFFNCWKKNLIKISVVNFCERVNMHDQKKFHQLKSKSIMTYKLTCDKFVKCWNLNKIWKFLSSLKPKQSLFMLYMIFYKFDCIKSFFFVNLFINNWKFKFLCRYTLRFLFFAIWKSKISINMISMIFFSEWIRKRNITKSIFLNAKINEVTKVNEIKSGYRNVVNIKIKEVITSINVIADNEENEWENNVTNNNWEKGARKTDTKRRYVSSMLINIIFFVESQYIKISKQIWWTEFEKF